MKGQKFPVVREFRPRPASPLLTHSAVDQLVYVKGKTREGGSKRSRGGEEVQMREMITRGKGEVKA